MPAGMKISVSLPEDDVAFLDAYAERVGTPSRSAVLQRAIGLLRAAGLEEQYAAAWDEWDTAEDAVLWTTTLSDGIVDAPG